MNIIIKIIDSSSFKIISIFGVVFGIFVGVFTLYQYSRDDTVKLEIKTIDKTLLTKIPEIENLTVEYKYQDSLVNNLWRIRYVISNVGSKTVIGKGNNKNLLFDCLPISIYDSVKILSIEIDDKNFPISLNAKENIVNLDFKQWKKSEFIDIIAIVENLGKTTPFISIDYQDIIGAEIFFSEFNPTEKNVNRKFIEFFPKVLIDILKWIVVIVILSLHTLIFISVRGEYKKANKKTKIIFVIIVLFTTIFISLPLLWIF